MKRLQYVATTLIAFGSTAPALATDIMRAIIAEVDPVAPASAALEQSNANMSSSKWGGLVDFNLGGHLSTGPEIWIGNFTLKSPSDSGQPIRHEDLWAGESEKIDAMRVRWTFTAWEQPQSMRGWYIKGGYSYTRINSRAHRYVLAPTGSGDAMPKIRLVGTAPDGTDLALISDIRHGVTFGFGNRWLYSSQKLSLTLGASITDNLRRTVSVESGNPNAQYDYESTIANLPDTRMATRLTPEANLGIGYTW